MRQFATILAVTTAAIATLVGCVSREVSRVDIGQQKAIKKPIPVVTERDIDILFVIDDSESMAQEQASLVANFPNFINTLQSIQGGLPNVHIGVISTDMGARDDLGDAACDLTGKQGFLQSALVGKNPICSDGSISLDGAFIRDVDDDDDPNTPRVQNYEGELADVFSCIAELGIDGCGFEQQLEAARAALSNTNENAGFIRENAFLAVIFITDEDDCSAFDNEMFRPDIRAPDSAFGPLTSFRCFEFGVQCTPDSARTPGEKAECEPRTDSPYMTNIEEYVTFLKDFKIDDPRKVIVAGIFGVDASGETPIEVVREVNNPDNNNDDEFDLIPACVTIDTDSSGNPVTDEDGNPVIIGQATPAVRLQAFLDQFPDRNTVDTICDEDLTDALDLVANLLAKVLDNPFCLTVDVDQDNTTEALEYDCQVSDVLYDVETPLAHCDNISNPTNIPCWYIQKNEADCANAGEPFQELVVERGDTSPNSDTQVNVTCAVK